MPTPRCRLHSATGAFFFSVLAGSALLLTGCATTSRGTKPASSSMLVAPPHVEVGRVLSYDPVDATAVIEFAPGFRVPFGLTGRKLIARKLDTLEPTARLVAAPYQSGRMLGAYVTSGRPGVEDEVVFDPEMTPAAQSAAPGATSSKPAAP